MTTNKMTINEFCDRHGACYGGYKWAIDTGCATMADLWRRSDMRHDWRIWIATRPGVLDQKTQRLFACWCVRQVWHLVEDERSRHAVEVAERYAVGTATGYELADARDAASAAYSTSVYTLPATNSNAAYAAYSTAATFAFEALKDASLYAERAAFPSIEGAQAGWLIANAKPCFEEAQ
jgi:hypothetical protein